MGIGLADNAFFNITADFPLGGIAMGTVIIVLGYHLARAIAPRDAEGTMMSVGRTGAHAEDQATAPGRRAKQSDTED
jgi:hypothetical protein